MKPSQAITLVFIVVLAIFIRFYHLDQVPAGLYYDEVDSGYQARSLIQTGKDYLGDLSPFYVTSFNSQRTPIPIYMTVLTTLLFATPEVQVRAPSALFGIMSVVLIYFLLRRWTNSHVAGSIGAFIFAVSPWQIQFSRFSHEGTSTVAVFLLGLWLLDRALQLKNLKWLVSGLLVTALGVYTYRTMSLFVPMALIGYGIVYWRELWKLAGKKLLLIALVPVVVIGPFLMATTLFASDTTRFAQLSISSDPATPIKIQRSRELDSGDINDAPLGKQALASSYLFHSKPLEWFYAVSANYLEAFSFDFLLINGDSNLRHTIGHRGMLYVVDIFGFLAGFLYVVNQWKKKQWWWLSLWLLLSPIPASLTFDGAGHAGRLFIFSAPLLIVISLGWWQIIIRFKKISLVLGILYLVSVVFYLHHYFVHYPVDSPRQFGYGFKQAMTKIVELEKDFQHVYMVDTKDPPMLYYLYWAKVDPTVVQDYGSQFSLENNFNKSLDKYKVVEWPQTLSPGTLYLVTQDELKVDLRHDPAPEGVKVHDVILYPDGEIAFYLISGQ